MLKLKYQVGDILQVISKTHGHSFKLNDEVRIVWLYQAKTDKKCCDIKEPDWRKHSFYHCVNKRGQKFNLAECEVIKLNNIL